MKTLQDYINELKEKEQTDVIDDLHITSEELVDRFDDRVEECFDELDTDDNEDLDE